MTDDTHDVQSLLGAYAMDALDDSERDTVERHLISCPACAAEAADLVWIRYALAELLAMEASQEITRN